MTKKSEEQRDKEIRQRNTVPNGLNFVLPVERSSFYAKTIKNAFKPKFFSVQLSLKIGSEAKEPEKNLQKCIICRFNQEKISPFETKES